MGVIVGHPFDTIKVSLLVESSAKAERSDSKLPLNQAHSFESVERPTAVKG